MLDRLTTAIFKINRDANTDSHVKIIQRLSNAKIFIYTVCSKTKQFALEKKKEKNEVLTNKKKCTSAAHRRINYVHLGSRVTATRDKE